MAAELIPVADAPVGEEIHGGGDQNDRAKDGEREIFEPSHPLNLLWQAFTDEIASGDPYSL